MRSEMGEVKRERERREEEDTNRELEEGSG